MAVINYVEKNVDNVIKSNIQTGNAKLLYFTTLQCSGSVVEHSPHEQEGVDLIPDCVIPKSFYK